MGQDISHDLIGLVQAQVHHYETRCALRLTCSKFAKHIAIFDERALPIFSTTTYKSGILVAKPGVRWAGRYTRTGKSEGGTNYIRLYFQPSLDHFLQTDLSHDNVAEFKLAFKPHAGHSYLRFYVEYIVGSKYEYTQSVLGKVLKKLDCAIGAWRDLDYYEDSSHFHSIPSHMPGATPFDLVSIVRFRENSTAADGAREYPRIYLKYTDYKAMMQELEHVCCMRDEFPVPKGYDLDADYERAQKRKRNE